MSANAINPVYTMDGEPITAIHDEQQLERYTARLWELDQKSDLSRDEHEVAELLTILIEHFEEEHYALPKSTPVDVLEHLMDARDMTQRNLAKIMCVPESVVSAILHGDRPLNARHIKRLAEHFHISQELFF
jgi:HTH-type transcriptional regulator / antitoxin HigA